MGNVNFLRTCYLSTQNKLLRNNVLNCWGSNQKVRNSSSKLLGFSASVALVGFGVHQVLKVDQDEVQQRERSNSITKEEGRGSLLDRILGLEPFSSKLLPTLKLLESHKTTYRNGGHSLFNSFKSFSLLTPVSCTGEDTICNCCCDDKKRPSAPSSGVIENCDCDCDECRQECRKTCGGCEECRGGSGGGGTEDQNIINNNCSNNRDNSSFSGGGGSVVPVTSSSSCSNNYSSGIRKGPSCTGNNTTPVSNKPCKYSGSQSCSQTSEIDIDALAAQLGGLKQIDFLIDSDLSHCFLMKQASQVAVDSVTRILTEAATAYEDYHAEYRRVIDMMMDTLEESRKACGAELEVIECKIVLIRAKVDEMKRRIQDVDMLLGSLEKLATASAEVAFMANAEYASLAMSERLQSLLAEAKRLRDESKEKERDMMELQSLIIVESGKSLK